MSERVVEQIGDASVLQIHPTRARAPANWEDVRRASDPRADRLGALRRSAGTRFRARWSSKLCVPRFLPRTSEQTKSSQQLTSGSHHSRASPVSPVPARVAQLLGSSLSTTSQILRDAPPPGKLLSRQRPQRRHLKMHCPCLRTLCRNTRPW